MRSSDLIKIIYIIQNAELSHITSEAINNATTSVQQFLNKNILQLIEEELTSNLLVKKFSNYWNFEDDTPWPKNHFMHPDNKYGFIFCPDVKAGPQIAYTKHQWLTLDGLAPDAEFTPTPSQPITRPFLSDERKEPESPEEVYNWNRRTLALKKDKTNYTHPIRGQWYYFQKHGWSTDKYKVQVHKVPPCSQFLSPLPCKTDAYYTTGINQPASLTTSGPGFMGSTEDRDNDFVETMTKGTHFYAYADCKWYFHGRLEQDLGYDIPIPLSGHLLNTDQQYCYVYNPQNNNKLIEEDTVIVKVNERAVGCLEIGDQDTYYIMYRNDLSELYTDIEKQNSHNTLQPYSSETTSIYPNI